MVLKMLILVCFFLILLNLKSSEGRGGRGYMVTGGRVNNGLLALERKYNTPGYWEKGGNKYVSNYFDPSKTIR